MTHRVGEDDYADGCLAGGVETDEGLDHLAPVLDDLGLDGLERLGGHGEGDAAVGGAAVDLVHLPKDDLQCGFHSKLRISFQCRVLALKFPF